MQAALRLKCSRQWLEIGRHKGYGPPYVKMHGKVVYDRNAVRAWLRDRAHRSTDEYETTGGRPREHVLYRHYDKDSVLLYIGISWNMAQRQSAHRDSPWFHLIATTTHQGGFATRAEAEAAEEAAVKAEKPRFNVVHNEARDAAD
jgi:hypothetical protein